MKNAYKQKRQQGFTIIEVMIVLAIASVILLIVLLAVPALQRNSRNTQRNNDAAQIAAAVNSCLANQNGNPATCQSVGISNVDIEVQGGVAIKLGQLSQPPQYSPAGAMGTTSQALWSFNRRCSGNASTTNNASPRNFIVTFQVESTGAPTDRCIEG